MLLGANVEAFEGEGSVSAVRLSGGRRVERDFAVVGVRVAPGTGLAEAAGIPVDNGILVDERLDTGVPGIFAAGDVANAHRPL